ncbi:MAG: NAD(P)/FAD-dependent oxidoreductase [Candidatus Dormibacteria bacterium]
MDARVVVAGGGPVGSALGLMLPGALVLEAGDFPRDKACGEGLMPSGARLLAEAGVELAREGFPPLAGVSYRVPGGPRSRADFRQGPGYGVRRTRFDSLLADRARVRCGVRVTGVVALPDRVLVETSAGSLSAQAAVIADGLHSSLARQLGCWRPPAGEPRFGLVGHLAWERPGADVEVTLLGEVETYLAPVGPAEVLVAILGSRGRLRLAGLSTEASYRAILERAHPELAGSPLLGPLRGAGPFRQRPSWVGRGRVFLAGDAAGFFDPLTGDAISAGLAQASVLARLLGADPGTAASRYQGWWQAQWRRRRAVGILARRLSGSPGWASRALRGTARRPQALQTLIEVNQGSLGLAALGLRDWAALGGLSWG